MDGWMDGLNDVVSVTLILLSDSNEYVLSIEFLLLLFSPSQLYGVMRRHDLANKTTLTWTLYNTKTKAF